MSISSRVWSSEITYSSASGSGSGSGSASSCSTHLQLGLLVSVQLTWSHMNGQEELNCLVYEHVAVWEVRQMVYEHVVTWKTQMVYEYAVLQEVHQL